MKKEEVSSRRGQDDNTQAGIGRSAYLSSFTADNINIYRCTGLTARELEVLEFIRTQGSVSIGDICEAFHVRRSAASGYLRPLKHRGLITKYQKPGCIKVVWMFKATTEAIVNA